ncbi:MAG: hypothetical protein R3Y43_04780 [Alphaproteobacteria bacterium]
MTKKKLGLPLIFLLTLLIFKVNASFYQFNSQVQPFIYVFWSGREECFHCEQTIELIYSVVEREFGREVTIDVVDYNQESYYKEKYDLASPLSIVMIRDNTEDRKIDLPTDVADTYSFSENLIFQIKNYFFFD